MRVAVVGSGPAGCAAAIALRRTGRQVSLIGDGRDGVGSRSIRSTSTGVSAASSAPAA